jgi:TRAP-type uncharacterized transport system fused permease subunit
MSAVIPPVALTSFTAATIAKANPNKTALTGLALGSAGLLLPFMFIYNPVLLIINFSWYNYCYSLLCALIGLYSIAISIMGVLRMKLDVIERTFLGLAAILLITPVSINRIIGLTIFGMVIFLHLLRAKKILIKKLN